MKKSKILIVGCGHRSEKYAINLDMVDLPGVDVQHNLEVFPYPFEDGQFEEIRAEDVLEHVDNIVGVMNELWRILEVGGTLWIRGPHANYPEQAWRDPTHRRLFVPHSFDQWDPTTEDGKHYGFYCEPAHFLVVAEKEVNKGMEYTLRKAK